ncbi:mitochondrial carrier homolog 2-like [Orbicella faveolata]|uniref:mitochondrial carrier homolog 2-like n=1 Tax=Orbicella faveolata TaxID=48498 RepID=UPI0009E6275C|nr:mitochondrial carrier homolog 2-like [Orbicella faveolata]
MAAANENGNGQSFEDLLDNEGTTAGALVLTAFMTTATQPLTCVRLLMQVGHEPIPPTPSKTFLGTKVLRLPSFFQYANHVKKLNGWSGLYRGLLPRVYSSMIGTLVNNTILQAMGTKDNALVPLVHPENKTKEEELLEFAEETCMQTVAKCSALIISHPFYVISVRMMVQFVGQETIYSGLRASIKEIYNNEGLAGFFSGVIPRLLGEILSLWLYRGACFLVSKYAIDSEVSRRKEVQVYTNGLFQYAAGVVTYPFTLVSHMMIVNHVGLAGGEPPAMPVFSGWTDCFKYLRKSGNLWRGSSMFRRTVRQVSGM